MWVLLQLKGDHRPITSREFATKYSLRFPVILRIRDDKGATSINTQDELLALISKKHDLTRSAPLHEHLSSKLCCPVDSIQSQHVD